MSKSKAPAKKKAEKPAGSKSDKLKAFKGNKPDNHVKEEKPAKEKKQKKEKISTKGKTTDELKQQVDEIKNKKPGVVTFQSIKLVSKKDYLSVRLSVIEPDHTVTTDTKELKRVVHADLKKALSAFRVHWLILCDYLSTQAVRDIKKYDQDLVETATVTGVIITVNGDDEKVSIIGHKYSRRKKGININSPGERFEEVDESRYKYMDDLQERLDVLYSEVEKYLDGSKVGDAQDELPFNNGYDDAAEKEDQSIEDAIDSPYVEEDN